MKIIDGLGTNLYKRTIDLIGNSDETDEGNYVYLLGRGLLPTFERLFEEDWTLQ